QQQSRSNHAKDEGVQFLSYIHPADARHTDLCAEAAKHGYLATDATGGDYRVVVGACSGGVVERPHPVAYDWFAVVLDL
ncbi:alpha-glucosidase, partial [Salmonella enterica subsp. enterica serovar Weltevreden]|nr:alpha-glucosidase [Salmonella enterica subsp. enterica serovar Weltevreden]